jgi:hypothetical protein
VSEIDDLYVILRAQTAPLTEGFLAAGTSGEELAAKIAASTAEVTAAVERMAASTRISSVSIEESVLADQIAFQKLALATQEASLKMEAATTKAAASNERLGASMAASSNKFSRYQGVLGLAALATVAVGAGAIHMAADFESSTNRLVTSAGEIHANLETVRAGLLSMAGDVGYSAETLSAAIYKVESAGFRGADALQTLRASAEGAKAENADLTLVADAVTSALIDYHKGAGDAALVTSKLVAATGAGKTTFQELAGSMSQILPVASAAHVSLDDILGDLASMTVHGMSAQQAAQNLADVIRHMQAPTAVQAKELALLGMTTNDLSNSLSSKGLSGTLQMISERIAKMMPPGSQKVILDMGTALRGLPPAVQALGQRLIDGSISMKEYNKAARDLDPIAAKQAASFATLAGSTHRIGDQQMTGAKVLQTYGSALSKATGDATGLRTTLMLTGENYKTTTGAIKAVSGATTEAGNHVKGWGDIQHTFNQKMSEAKAGMGALATSVGEKLLPAASKLVGWLADGAKWLSKHQTVATILAVALTVLAVGFTVAAVAVWAMNSALLANPITWIIIAIVAAVAILAIAIYELVTHWKQIWGWIKDVAADVWHWLVKVWHSIAKSAEDIWKNDIVKPIKDAWHSVSDFFKDAWHAVADPIEKAWHKIEDTTKAVWNGITGFFKKWWPLLLVIFAFPIAVLLGIWNRWHTQITNAVHTVWNAIKDFFATVWNGIKTAASAAWGLIKDYIVKPVEAVWHRIVAVWDIIAKALDKVWEKVKAAAKAVWDEIKANIIKPIEDAWHQIESVGERIWKAISGAFDRAWNSVKNIGDRFLDIGKNIVMGIVHGVENAAGRLFDTMKNLANDALKAAKNFLGISSPAKRASDEIGQWLPHGVADGVNRYAGVAIRAMAELSSRLTVSPSLSMAGGLSFDTGGGSMAPPGGGAPFLAGGSTPMVGTVGGGGYGGPTGPVEVNVYIDGEQIRNVTVRQAQRNKSRNGHTGLT